MTRKEVLNWIDEEMLNSPEYASGNETINSIIEKIKSIIYNDRVSSVAAFRYLIGQITSTDEVEMNDPAREAKMWLVLEIASVYGLTELCNEIDDLILRVKNGELFHQYYYDQMKKIRDKIQKG